jgi:hypothetical protein
VKLVLRHPAVAGVVNGGLAESVNYYVDRAPDFFPCRTRKRVEVKDAS